MGALPLGWWRLLIGAALWAIGLNGGTLALNSYFDDDAGGDVGYLDRPPKPPRFLWLFGFGLMIGALGLAGLLGLRLYFYAYAACLILSVLYSVPPWRLKSVAGADMLVNVLGYGALTFLAGALLIEKRPGGTILALAGAAGLLFAGFYPLTQVYQMEEDAAHGDRTLAVRLGRKGALVWALVFTGAGMVLCGVVFMWRALALPPGTGVDRVVGAAATIIATMFGWAWVIAPWARRAPDRERDKAGMYAALRVWALADLALVLCARI